MSNRYTKERAAFIFGQDMEPCPRCGSYHIGYSTPIKMAEPITPQDGARQILGKWARATQSGHTPLEGPVRLVCRECGHQGPALDCTGRTSEDVGCDPAVAAEVKRLWNTQGGKVAPGVLFAVMPRWVTSHNDGQRHFITAGQLLRLYGVPRPMTVEIPSEMPCPPGLFQLRPRFDGNYSLPRELREKVDQFKRDSHV